MTMDDDDGSKDGKLIQFFAYAEDLDVIDGMRSQYGNCSQSSAIRACIRIARDVKLELSRRPFNNGE